MSFRQNIFAKLRTLMANERTLLSYYRTSMAILGVSAFTYRFYPTYPFRIAALLLAFLAVAIFIYGSIRYARFNARIKKR